MGDTRSARKRRKRKAEPAERLGRFIPGLASFSALV
jgi:hypothetical protein